MRVFFLLASVLFAVSLLAQVQLSDGWLFQKGDDESFASPSFYDKSWQPIKPTTVYENQGHDGYNGYSWYRIHFKLPRKLRDASFLKDSVRLLLGKVDDADATYLNGVLIGQTGQFPNAPKGNSGGYNTPRRYVVAHDNPILKWDAENVIAVRVYDGGGGGGLWGGVVPNIGMVDAMDFVTMDATSEPFKFDKIQMLKTVRIQNRSRFPLEGILTAYIEGDTKEHSAVLSYSLMVGQSQEFSQLFRLPRMGRGRVRFVFEDNRTGKTIVSEQETPYILTPPEVETPRINNPSVYGVRPRSTFQLNFAVSGKRPMTFGVEGLPEGLTMDARGFIKGIAPLTGVYPIVLTAKNKFGETQKTVTIKVGHDLALTPPMGWNSWNCWGLAISDERVRAAAAAMARTGLSNYGWQYINIDDGWQGVRDSVSGELLPNAKFPNMRTLSDYVHGQGLKIGIYSSPGPTTCGGFLGSYQHEKQDATSFGAWGMDYLKYDWCSYGETLQKPESAWTLEDMKKPFADMRLALQGIPSRDVVFSLCQYGMGDVWTWGNEVGGQLWRTTGDIDDSWESLAAIGFKQQSSAAFCKPGGWNDQDMLIVGTLGWGDMLRPTRLTPSEQYTHISLWALQSAPLLLGCDLSQLDSFALNLLTNSEIINIDQDVLGKAATLVLKEGDIQYWVKELSDGSKAVGIFNLADTDQKITVNWAKLGITKTATLRDAWQQKELGPAGKKWKTSVFSHGVLLLVVK